eukprot:4199728-Prymnesium_polylepis.1
MLRVGVDEAQLRLPISLAALSGNVRPPAVPLSGTRHKRVCSARCAPLSAEPRSAGTAYTRARQPACGAAACVSLRGWRAHRLRCPGAGLLHLLWRLVP